MRHLCDDLASFHESLAGTGRQFLASSGRPPALGSGEKTVPITISKDYTIIDAYDTAELTFYLSHLRESGLITLREGPRRVGEPLDRELYQLTYKGWDHVLGTSATSAEYGRVFVAMWFDDSMESAYTEGIAPALRTAGYEPVCMNAVFHNDDIQLRDPCGDQKGTVRSG